MATSFIARTAFPVLDSLPRSYYLGHHAAGLQKMRTLLAQIDLIIECRDYRVPLTSHNPLFEDSLAGKERMIVYTKKDLGRTGKEEDVRREALLRQWHHPSPVLFSSHTAQKDTRSILSHIASSHASRNNLTGSHLMVVGMPNIGKSSLINALRRVGVNKGKAAQTGDQPGVTRNIAKSGVKIIDGGTGDGGGGSVYLVDTPGVFIPYVPDAEAMLKLALCGSVKDTILPPTILADYLLYHLNKHYPKAYSDFSPPTNDILALLSAIAIRNGRLGKGAVPDLEAAALWMVQRWRDGRFGAFVLDDVTEEAVAKKLSGDVEQGSLSQARKAVKEAARARNRAKVKQSSAG
ncbi:Mitochondrial GTPase 1 [Oleoguttula sp. CCFEE 5521]